MAARMSEIGMSAMRASEIGMRYSAANLQMMAGTMANKAYDIATIFSRSTSLPYKQQQAKTVPTAKAEDEDSPMSQHEELQLLEPGVEAAQIEPAVSPEKRQDKKNQQEQEKKKELILLLPWEIHNEDGTTSENLTVKQKILELAIYRRTFVEPAAGEEEYVFDYTRYKGVARELLLSNPNLREKRETLVESVPVAVVSEETFWRNFFLRCNAVCVAEGMPSYLPEMEQVAMTTGPLARLTRGLFGMTFSSANSSKQHRGFLTVGRSTLSESTKTSPSNDDLSDLELDVDGEIEKELVKRRPSRAVELCVRPAPSSQERNTISTEKEKSISEDASKPSQCKGPEKQAAIPV